jgi:drug/metabolite transporter (DMT)-like permease
MSFKFILLYVGVIFSLFIYAIIWQQILKRIDLTTAFANKSAMLFWSLVWGVTIFHEQVKVQIIIGLLFVGLGVYFVVKSNE